MSQNWYQQLQRDLYFDEAQKIFLPSPVIAHNLTVYAQNIHWIETLDLGYNFKKSYFWACQRSFLQFKRWVPLSLCFLAFMISPIHIPCLCSFLCTFYWMDVQSIMSTVCKYVVKRPTSSTSLWESPGVYVGTQFYAGSIKNSITDIVQHLDLACHLLCFRDQCISIMNQYKNHLSQARSSGAVFWKSFDAWGKNPDFKTFLEVNKAMQVYFYRHDKIFGWRYGSNHFWGNQRGSRKS